jgi:glycerol-3-phosphate acyltransferase PlsY
MGSATYPVSLQRSSGNSSRFVQGSTLVFLLVPIAYALGTFPSAILIARANGIDISTFGSGNPGASNVTRALGWRKGVWVYVLDAGKGALAAGLGLALDGRPLAYWCGAAAVVGHMFPILRRFKGGKGVATGSGVLLIVQPILAPLALGLWWLVTKVTGKAALGSLIAVALVPIGLIVQGKPAWEFIAVAGLCALILVKHAGNIVRLIRREEHSLRKK